LVKLSGETMREIGILVSVFGPLDAFFQLHGDEGGPPALAVGIILLAGLICIGLGIVLEMEVEA
jgi:hypothetical protein